MIIRIENLLDRPLHMAVVRHSPSSIECVVSETRMPIPSGKVQHYDVGPGEGLRLWKIPDKTLFSMSFASLPPGSTKLTRENGTEDGEYCMRIRIRPPGPDDHSDKKTLN